MNLRGVATRCRGESGRTRRALKSFVRDRETDWRFTGVVAALYLVFLIWMHVHHEMWRDEIHAWSLARIAQGFGDLVTGDRRYEGHPPLWFWYLRVWSWITPSRGAFRPPPSWPPSAPRCCLLRYAPFPRYLKVLLLLLVLFGYEYTVMSRNYVLGWLFLCLFCAAYHPFRLRH